MRQPMTDWISRKIAAYLQDREGCEVVDVKNCLDGHVITMQDVFGFRYTVEVKTVARVNNDPKGLEIYDIPKKSSFLASNLKFSK